MILSSVTRMMGISLTSRSVTKGTIGLRAYASVWPDTFGWITNPSGCSPQSSSSFSTDRKQSVALDDELLQKYKEKLAQKAKREGVNTIEELIKKHSHKPVVQKQTKPELPTTDNNIQTKVSSRTPSKKQTDQPIDDASQSDTSLSKVMKIELLMNESPENISKIWTTFYTEKECLSAVVPGATYRDLVQKMKKFPQFLIPLPREQGHEFYFMQSQFHQIYFTSLLEYKTHGSQARPHLILTHYPELLESKDIVLMRGDLGNDPTDSKGRIPLSMVDAKLLVYLFQQFYITGGPAKQKLVEVFNSTPAQFDHQKLLDEANRIN